VPNALSACALHPTRANANGNAAIRTGINSTRATGNRDREGKPRCNSLPSSTKPTIEAITVRAKARIRIAPESIKKGAPLIFNFSAPLYCKRKTGAEAGEKPPPFPPSFFRLFRPNLRFGLTSGSVAFARGRGWVPCPPGGSGTGMGKPASRFLWLTVESSIVYWGCLLCW